MGRGAWRGLLPTFLFLLLASCEGGSPPPPRTIAVAVPDSSFGFRDPREGADLKGFKKKHMRLVDAGVEAFLARDYEGALALFRAGRYQIPNPDICELGEIYAGIAGGGASAALPRLEKLVQRQPGYISAVEALGDVLANLGREREALDRYRSLLRLVPGDARAVNRIATMKARMYEKTRVAAVQSLERGDLEGARKAGTGLISLDARAPGGYEVLARVAEASGKFEDAYSWAVQASNRGTKSPEWEGLVAEMAMKTGRYAEAVGIYDSLAKKEERYREKAENARLEFRIQNLPDPARKAALSPRLTRGQLATLLWWTVAEIRQRPVTGQSQIATDVVDHPDRQAVIRAIGLGFLRVSEDTHRVGVETPVGRQELGNVLRRLAVLSSAGVKMPGCLSTEPASLQALESCGILPASSVKTVTGREAIRAIERTVRLAREGYVR